MWLKQKSKKLREAKFKVEGIKEDQVMEHLISHIEEFGFFFPLGE